MNTTVPDRPREARRDRIRQVGYDYAAQEKAAVDSCNLCGGRDWLTVTQRDRYEYPAQAVACRRCGLTTLSPRMSAAAYAEFYRHVYRPLVSAYHGRLIDAQSIQGEQADYADTMIGLLAPVVAGRGYETLLDVGGSTGIVSSWLARAFGWRATVIDPAPAEAAVARSLGIETVVGFVEDWTPDGTFDVIGMFQTIDHLLDASATLAKLRSILSPGGLFVVDIVDFRRAYRRHRSLEEGIKIDHVYSFTEMTTEPLLARAGFAPLHRVPSADNLHVTYVCEGCEPDSRSLPAPADLDAYFAEIAGLQAVGASRAA